MMTAGWRCSAVLQIERVEPIAESSRPIVMPGDDKKRFLIVADHRGAEDAPLGIVRAPHIDVFAAGSRLPEPRRPQGDGAAVGTAILLVRVVDVHRVVHRCDDDSVKGSLYAGDSHIGGCIDRECGHIQRLSDHLTIGK